MNARLAAAELAARYKLSPDAKSRLQAIASSPREPAELKPRVLAGAAILGAALGGMGVIFWIAANWESLSRFGKFALLQALVVTMCIGAIWRPQARRPLGLIAMLGIGALFAYFGQTYQTGADPWQLFALWAVLSLPLCISTRHDTTWAPWALIALTAIGLWVNANVGWAFNLSGSDLGVHFAAWSGSLLLCFALGPWLRHWTGAGIWSLRVAITLTAFLIALPAAAALFQSDIAAQYWLGLTLLGGAALVFAHPGTVDIFALSVLGLALNGLLVGAIAHAVLDTRSPDPVLGFLVIGAAAAVLLSLTVKAILKLSRDHEEEGATP
ncbi:DUF2157 domain-containing protein [Massilia sp. PAMC28688]|uniref:DUF2157 domain-containing protein n=1 Tax=Massilia sp. PAMC28688 TaxID=2861283 RepID=UPI001C639509|nr:DUF2157 domain-containing protein [Massilia sp. PAMC28688]QYF94605.1 DUF2157 domain-containing protein [Massilia sp. PAMC28688]